MTCAEARFLIGANPGGPTPELEEHLRTCDACRTYRREMVELEAHIGRALHIDLGTSGASAIAQAPPSARARRTVPLHVALAASVLVVVLSGALFWMLRPIDALALEVVAHVAHEPKSWSLTAPVPPTDLDAVLTRAGITLDPAAPDVVYARTCPFRGRDVPHLVVRTADGPVTVLVLAGERITVRHDFSEFGFTGVLVPASGGSVAVLARNDAQVDDAARLVMHALHWQAAPTSSPPLE